MKIISSQHYLNYQVVESKITELDGMTSITLTCWDAGEIDGEQMAVLSDGHHTLAAARELGIAVEFDVIGHPEYLTGEALLTDSWMDGDWYRVETSDPINEVYDLVW